MTLTIYSTDATKNPQSTIWLPVCWPVIVPEEEPDLLEMRRTFITLLECTSKAAFGSSPCSSLMIRAHKGQIIVVHVFPFALSQACALYVRCSRQKVFRQQSHLNGRKSLCLRASNIWVACLSRVTRRLSHEQFQECSESFLLRTTGRSNAKPWYMFSEGINRKQTYKRAHDSALLAIAGLVGPWQRLDWISGKWIKPFYYLSSDTSSTYRHKAGKAVIRYWNPRVKRKRSEAFLKR